MLLLLPLQLLLLLHEGEQGWVLVLEHDLLLQDGLLLLQQHLVVGGPGVLRLEQLQLLHLRGYVGVCVGGGRGLRGENV